MTSIFVRPAFVSLVSVLFFFSNPGCDKVQEFTNQNTTAEAPSIAAAQPHQQAPAAVSQPMPPANAVPAPVLEDPQVVINKFINTPTTSRTDSDIARLAGLTSGTDAITEMDLAASGITNAGLKQLPKLSNIETLNLSFPKSISEEGFVAVLELPKLKRLNLTTAQMNEAMVDIVAKMSQLEVLSVEGNKVIGDSAIEKFSVLQNLRELNLSATLISDSCFTQLAKMKQLEVLNVSHTTINGQGMQHLKRKHDEVGLRVLNAQNTRFGDNGFAYLRDAETLEELIVNDAAVTDRSMLALKGHNELKKLHLGYNQITDANTKVLGTMRKLEELNISHSKVSDLTFNSISKHKQLRVLIIEATNCTIPSVVKLKKLLPDCAISFNGMKY